LWLAKSGPISACTSFSPQVFGFLVVAKFKEREAGAGNGCSFGGNFRGLNSQAKFM